ncbi:clathrin heavy chain linker domain-containing protein 1-like isoform 3-T3 [Anableps anableps]
MNKEQNDTEDSEMNPVIDIDLCESDRTFFRSLYKFIEEEKKYLQCPEEGANELRYIIYRSAFNKVIGRASAYRRLLLDIKFEYDGTIREMLRREDDDATSRLQSLLRWAAHIRDRTSILQNQTAELQEEVRRQKSAQSRLVPGLTLAQSEDPEVLEDHLEHLETQRDVLLDRKCQCCPAEVQTHLTFDLQEAELHRNRLRDQNQQLITWFRRLKLVGERLRSWEETGQAVPLEDLLGSTIQNLLEIRTKSLQDEGSDEDSCIPAELLEEEEPTGQDESRLLKDHLDRLTFTEELGDALTEHAQNHPAVADLCLALASTVYQACGQHQKTALSMCRRGLVHAAVEVIKHQKLTAEDSLWILSRSPSLSLLQLLTSSQGGQAAILSVGGTCAFMLVDSSQQQVALELLDGLLRRGPGEWMGPVPARLQDVPMTSPCPLRRAAGRHPGGQQLLGGRLGAGGVPLLRPEAGRPAAGHPLRPPGPGRNRGQVTGPGGGPAHGARLPVRRRHQVQHELHLVLLTPTFC